MSRQAEILMRRKLLRVRIATQRLELADAIGQIQERLGFADTALNAARVVRAHPVLLAGGIALLVWRFGTLRRLANTALRLWGIYLSISSALFRPWPKTRT